MLGLGILVNTPMDAERHEEAFAEELAEPIDAYTHTFTISAYYSPLPCQSRYATGSYDGDIRLNGGGVRGADGTPVYPGMIAAPKSYPFGVKMDIPGIGIVAVHDRGGAIKAAGGAEGVYDRLDVWMGYGDKGLERALQWGKRTMDVVVYGINDSISEQIILAGYSADEASAGSCDIATGEIAVQVEEEPVVQEMVVQEPVKIVSTVTSSSLLQNGHSGEEVRALQTELKKLNFFKGEVTGYYGELTEHAVFKFQQSQLLVGGLMDPGAGIFGPKTRERMREIVAGGEHTRVMIAQATNAYNNHLVAFVEPRKREDADVRVVIASQLDPGVRGPEVAALQKFLKEHGYFSGAFITDYFGPATHEAVLKFQLDNKIITGENDKGAGRVGPATRDLINNLS